jgi:hypothetical protein
MAKSDIAELAGTGGVGLLIIIMAIFLFAGKAPFLISGYNTLPKIEKAKYDEVALGKFLGGILLPVGIFLPCLTLADIYNVAWFPWLFWVGTLGLSIFAVIYCNTGNRFKK